MTIERIIIGIILAALVWFLCVALGLPSIIALIFVLLVVLWILGGVRL